MAYENQYIPEGVSKVYSDLDLNFTAHPVTGDTVKKKNIEAIKVAIKHLVYLNFYEKPFHPEIGTGLYASLFENAGDDTLLLMMKNRIESAIAIYEPRAEEIHALVRYSETDPNAIYVTVYFTPVNEIDSLKIEFFLKPTR